MTCLYADAAVVCDREGDLAGYCAGHAPRGSDAAIMLSRYASAIRSVVEHGWGGVRCVHGVELAQDCDECEPMLDHDSGFERG